MPSKTCLNCGKDFIVGGRGNAKRTAVYCSRRCHMLARPPLANPGSHAPRPRKNKDTLHNETWLRARYLDERKSSGDIAKMLGCSVPSVLFAIRKFDIPVRDQSEAKIGRPSKAVWTPEMREALAAKRRGSANPMFGTTSPWAGRHKPFDQETRHYGRGRARVLFGPEPCTVCGKPNAQRHHANGDTSDNSRENVVPFCPKHHLHIGHNGHWGELNNNLAAAIESARADAWWEECANED